MDVLFKGIKIVAEGHPHNGERVNLLLKNGKIAAIDTANIQCEGETVEADTWSVSPSWFDMRTALNQPGFEHKDTFRSLAGSALKGGFSDLAVLPNTFPCLQRSGDIENVLSQSEYLPVSLHPVGAASADTEGNEMTELIDMAQAGAVAFSDGEHPLQDTSLIKKLLLYLKQFDGLLMNIPSDKALEQGGHLNEGVISTMMGTKGIPATSEHLAIQQQLEILRYTGGKIHFSLVSSKRSLDLIRAAKAEGLAVTADVSVNHLIFTDEDMMGFDTNLKAYPPFRTAADRQALWEALADGTVDAIVSDHRPQDIESKNLEFDLADFGLLGLESFFGALMKCRSGSFPLDKLLHKFGNAPRVLLGLPEVRLEEGEDAELTFFEETGERLFDISDIESKSKNSPFIGEKVVGAVKGVATKGRLYLFD